jgi:uncharacterized protein (TIGR03435 family)
MKKLSLQILFALFILKGTFARAEAPKPGESAPQLKLTSLLQASGKLEQNLKSLNGKVIVLEFWATWCAPCIASMPHLNDLSEKFKNKGVQFISITDESAEKASHFLKSRKINGWVGIDGDKAMQDAYGVETIPLTVIIGFDGKVVGYPHSKDLSEEMLNQVIAGNNLIQPTPVPVSAAPTDSVIEVVKPLYELSIRTSTHQSMSRYIGNDRFETRGAPALELIKVAFDADLKQTEITAQLPEGKFDVVATNLGKGASDWEWMTQLQRMLQEIWGIDIRQKPKEMEVYELVATANADKRLAKTKAGERFSNQSSGEGVLGGRNISMPVLGKALQELLSTPVVDLTNLKGNYDYTLYYEDSNPETLVKSLEKEMGLKLRKVKRTIDVLKITPKIVNNSNQPIP